MGAHLACKDGPEGSRSSQGWRASQKHSGRWFPTRAGVHANIDLNTPVDSINNSSGAHEGLGGSRRDIYPMDAVKPRVDDACVSVCILWATAELVRRVAALIMLLDYKYFFSPSGLRAS